MVIIYVIQNIFKTIKIYFNTRYFKHDFNKTKYTVKHKQDATSNQQTMTRHFLRSDRQDQKKQTSIHCPL